MNKKKLMIGSILVLAVAIVLVGLYLKKAQNKMVMPTGLSETHYGMAIMKTPSRDKLEDVYRTGKIEKIQGYGDFDRKVVSYGLTLMIHKDISDEFVNKITATMMSMFPKNENMDLTKQEEILQNMYRYKAMLPVVINESAMSGDAVAKLTQEYSLCDIIMKTKTNQVNEVVEHLLHAINDVGLHYTYPNEWGINKSSEIGQAMNKAIENKYYNIKDYKGYPGDVHTRVIVQEYAYWVITSIWDLQKSNNLGEGEWSLQSPEQIKKSQPDLLTLYDRTLKNVMVVPGAELLKSFD